MFLYTHLRTDNFGVSGFYTFSNTVDPITNTNTAFNIPGFSGSSSNSSFTRISLDGDSFIREEGLHSVAGGGAGFDDVVVTSRTSYLSGTHSASSRFYTSSRAGTRTRYDALATNTSSSVNLASADFDVGYFTISYGGLTNGTKTNAGSSTATGSATFTYHGTKTSVFSTTWFTNASTTVSGSASMTTTDSSITLTGTLSGVTTLTWCFGEMVTEQRWYNARQLPPPLRRCAGLLQVTSMGTGLKSFQTVSHGEINTASTALITSSYSNEISSQTIFEGDSDGGGETARDTYLTSVQGFRGTQFSTTNLSLVVLAKRSILTGACFALNEFSTAGSAYSLSPSVSESSDLFVPFGHSASFPFVFTDRITGKTVNGSSATLQWKYSSSSWKLYATLGNSDTSTTTEISVQTSGSMPTTTQTATNALGCSTAILGPLYGLSEISLHEISLTITNNRNSSESLSGHFGFSGNSFTQSSTSPVSSSSFSSADSFSSSYSYGLGVANSTNRSFFANQYANSISTSTFLWPASTANTMSEATFTPANTGYFQAKWNEAGRGDPVSVGQ